MERLAPCHAARDTLRGGNSSVLSRALERKSPRNRSSGGFGSLRSGTSADRPTIRGLAITSPDHGHDVTAMRRDRGHTRPKTVGRQLALTPISAPATLDRPANVAPTAKTPIQPVINKPTTIAGSVFLLRQVSAI